MRSLCLILFLVLSCLTGRFAQGDPGFWPVDSVDIPRTVRAQAHAVYQIFVLDPEPGAPLKKPPYEELLRFERGRLEEDMQRPSTAPASGEPGRYYQVRACREAHRDACDIRRVLYVGTAFEASISGKEPHLWMSSASLGALARKDEDRVARGIPVSLLLVNAEQEVVFDSRTEGHCARVADLFPDIGVLRLTLTPPIGQPLPFPEQTSVRKDALEDLFILGYPLVQRPETGNEDAYAYPLKRYRLNVTIGEAFQAPAHSREASGLARIECDADSAPGMAGGPVFNEAGQLIGLLTEIPRYNVGSRLATVQGILERIHSMP
jgi:hypothetical protein